MLCIIHLLLAVDETTEVGLLAPMALVEGTSMVGELLRLLEVKVVFVSQALIIENALVLGIN